MSAKNSPIYRTLRKLDKFAGKKVASLEWFRSEEIKPGDSVTISTSGALPGPISRWGGWSDLPLRCHLVS